MGKTLYIENSSDPMTKQEVLVALSAIVTTLDEVEYAPESTLYIGVGMNLDRWNTIRKMLEAGNLIVVDGDHSVRITPTGHDLAVKINALLPERMKVSHG